MRRPASRQAAGSRPAGLLRFLNAPHQAIIETPARMVVSFDFAKFSTALQTAVTAGL
jgi:hypothetical protein